MSTRQAPESYGVAITWVPPATPDPLESIEVWFAPDSGGTPNTGAAAITLIQSPTVDGYTTFHETPSDSVTRWYQARLIRSDKSPGPYTSWYGVTSANLRRAATPLDEGWPIQPFLPPGWGAPAIITAAGLGAGVGALPSATAALVVAETRAAETGEKVMLALDGRFKASDGSLDAKALRITSEIDQNGKTGGAFANLSVGHPSFANVLGSGTLTDYYGVRVYDVIPVGAAVTNNYGLYIEDINSGANDWAIRTNVGLVQFGDLLLLPATTTSRASLRVPHGTAPSSPVDGDMWTTTAGLYVRINGGTVGPLT